MWTVGKASKPAFTSGSVFFQRPGSLRSLPTAFHSATGTGRMLIFDATH